MHTSTETTHSRIESQEASRQPAPASRGASPEGERSETPARRPAPGVDPSGGDRLDELLAPRELPEEVVEDALTLARLRRLGFSGLPDDVRERLPDALIDELLDGAGGRSQAELVGPGGLLADLTRRLVERAMAAELTGHLGYQPHAEPPGGAGNTRNGTTAKTLQTDHGPVRIDAPRDRKGTFEPQIVKKGERRFAGFDDKIVAMYARGMTTRDIEAHLAEIYGVSVGRDTISRVCSAVLEDAQEWQTRPLEAIYPIVYLDAMVIKVREERAVRKHACYLAIGVNTDGEREVLGMWFQRSEGAKFWLGVLTELKARGVEDVLVCCVDGLSGFSEAIEAVYPQAWVQTCIVHQTRASLKFVSYRDRKAVAADLKKIYTAVDRDHAWDELERFADK